VCVCVCVCARVWEKEAGRGGLCSFGFCQVQCLVWSVLFWLTWFAFGCLLFDLFCSFGLAWLWLAPGAWGRPLRHDRARWFGFVFVLSGFDSVLVCMVWFCSRGFGLV